MHCSLAREPSSGARVIRCHRVLRRIAIGSVLGLSLARVASANPAGVVAGGVDSELGNVANKRVDVLLTLDYEYEQDLATIWRERVGDPAADPNAPLPTHRDLAFKQFRHLLTPRLAVGLYRDFFFTAALPVVIMQAR